MNQTIRNMGGATAQNRNIKLGLTVLEVMFAMVIVLTGLIGVAAMVPFAIRQAEDSYRINHALSAGENALAVFNSQSIVQPRLDATWQFVDDEFATVDSALVAGTWAHFYQGSEYEYRYVDRGLVGGGDVPARREQIARLQNQMIGTGFCIDPLFWASQTRVRVPKLAWGNYRRSRFPFYQETIPNSFEPLENSVGSPTPRLRRVSLADPLPTGTGNGGWLRLPAAIQVATISGGDVVTAQPEEDRSAAPLRGEYVDGTGALIQSLTNGSTVSWMATLTPSDSTPIITSGSLNLNINPPPIETLPESYDLAVVVFGKRDVREEIDPSVIVASGVVPSSERIANMIPVGTEYLNSGTFDIDIAAGASVDPNMKIGDWVMLSRYVYENPYSPTIGTEIRERHKWYRVISVGADDAFPVRIRLAGEPWGFTEHEITKISNLRRGNPSLPQPYPPQTAVTMLKNVIQVYQRSITTQAF